jgi:hypothetical protein
MLRSLLISWLIATTTSALVVSSTLVIGILLPLLISFLVLFLYSESLFLYFGNVIEYEVHFAEVNLSILGQIVSQ